MEMNSNKARDIVEEEVKLEEDSLNNSCLVLTRGFN